MGSICSETRRDTLILTVLCSCLALGTQTLHGQNVESAVKHSDVVSLEKMIAVDPTLVNARDDWGLPVIDLALIIFQDEAVELLLKRGADPNIRSERGRSPLFYLKRADPGMAAMLLQYGADPNIRDSSGCPILQYCIEHAFPFQTIQELLTGGASPNTTWDGWTALDLAEARGYTWFADTLRRYGGVSTGKGNLFNAVLEGNAQRFSDLLDTPRGSEAAMATAPFIDNATPLHLAVLLPDSTIASMLIRHGSPVDVSENHGETPLHWAARTGNLTNTKLLLHHGANPNARDQEGVSSLVDISDREDEFWYYVFRRLSRDAYWTWCFPDSPAVERVRSLGTMIARNRQKITELLIDHGAAIDAVDYRDWTPLQIALAREESTLARWLLNHGADPNAVNIEGERAIHIAARHEALESIELLLRYDIDIDAQDSSGRTPLMNAIEGVESAKDVKGIRCVRTLLNHGADPDRADHNGRTPRSIAAARGVPEIEALLDRKTRKRPGR